MPDSPALAIQFTAIPAFNLALQQNALPVIQALTLRNATDAPLQDLDLVFTATPAVILPKTRHLDELKAGGDATLHDLGVELNYDFLALLSDTVRCKLRVEVRQGDAILAEAEQEADALAVDQWTGLNLFPELLAAFVTPNLELFSAMQAQVAEELRQATGNPAVDGYQSDRKRVYETCAAIYRVLHGWGIQYANPPSSYGTPGQRIRFADAIAKYRLGTCLDTTLLFASAMEHCLLHPVIMVQEGHAYIGCHLVDRFFPDLPVDDLQSIRKLVDLDEFLVFETTMVTGSASFSEAEQAARVRHLSNDREFRCAIDVVRARNSQIRAIPLKRSTDGMEFEVPAARIEQMNRDSRRDLKETIDLDRLSPAEARTGRVARWSQKLLDLSLRNRLLNLRDGKLSIHLACPDLPHLEDLLATNETIALNSIATLLGEKDLHDLMSLPPQELRHALQPLLKKELAQNRLWTLLTMQETSRRLTALYRQGRSDLEEGGVNTLFLAIGLLQWKPTETDSHAYTAPILMIPVRMQRKSMAEGIRLSRLDEETVVNETLLELLRTQFHLTIPGLAPLPVDEAGVDVSRILQIFRQSIQDMKGWEVLDEAVLGHFSFGKFVMWNDLTARVDDLRQNPLVSHLISGGGLFDDGVEVFPAQEVARHLDLKRLYCPMSADSSQLAAVLYSELGKSFVLHGPPGTGKSQTITNIIAHNLALGRRVLFVSEKKAALDVVHRRLSSVGLKPFCLELHSNKAGKTAVLAQFSEALAVPETAAPEEWERTADALDQSRDELNAYVAALHHRHPNGLTAYDCFSQALLDQAPPPAGLLQMDCLAQGRDDFETARTLAADLDAAWQNTSAEALHALRWLPDLDWSPVVERDLMQRLHGLEAAANALGDCFRRAAALLALPDFDRIDRIADAARFADSLQHARPVSARFLEDNFGESIPFLQELAKAALSRAELAKRLSAYQLEQLPRLDCEGLARRLRDNRRSFFVLRFFRNRALLKELDGLKKLGGGPLTAAELADSLPLFAEYNALQQRLDADTPKAAALLGPLWNNGAADWTGLAALLEQAQSWQEEARRLTPGAPAARTALLARLRELLPDASTSLAPASSAQTAIAALLDALRAFQGQLDACLESAPDLRRLENLSELGDALRGIQAHAPDLRATMIYRHSATPARARGMAGFCDALEKGALAAPVEVFDSAYRAEMLNQLLAASQVLSHFSGATREQRIRLFQELDRKYTSLAQKAAFARLAARLPRRRTGPCPEGTELGILKRECEKRARQKPIRQLLEQIPTLAPILKPCFLMSPLSVAQYLPPDTAPFDLIVFDEASQIPVWDAIGVIARGRQLIVVGDPKQMPPTNFFQKGDADGDDASMEDVADDLESILDECISAGLFSATLNWHYRSRHEALIAFSNHYYYGDKLFTFPAARDSERLGVQFHLVPDGVYDRRSSRTNRREAEALVKWLFARLEAAGDRRRSVGVVTFSQAQQELIEDLIENERARHPALEDYFGDASEEPPFVKNLENVQGDERDVILFSVGYAPDADGKFSMNFGPLNRQGGERRLNVAITRAREQVVVFSSVEPQQIDTTRTGAVGAAHLKYFLEYARNGASFQGAQASADRRRDGLAATIAAFLTEHGYAVEHDLGCSSHHLDLAVRHPDRPGEFLLGIECDGPGYAAQNTTRDRDALRDSVLASLGWHTCHAWSVDWTYDRTHAESALLQLLEKLRAEPPQTEPEPPPPTEPEPTPAAQPPAATPPPLLQYKLWVPEETLPSESFNTPAGRALLRQQIHDLIETEGPVFETILRKRIVKAWGFARLTDAIQTAIREALPDELETSNKGIGRVFWPKGVHPEDYRDFRVSDDKANRRAVDEIPTEELANAMRQVFDDLGACDQENLYRETIRLLGFAVLTARIRPALDLAYQHLNAQG